MPKYFAVIYLKNGNVDWSKPFDTVQEAVDLLKKTLATPGKLGVVKATTVCKREVESEFMFGHPAKYDLLQDKKFLKGLEKE